MGRCHDRLRLWAPGGSGRVGITIRSAGGGGGRGKFNEDSNKRRAGEHKLVISENKAVFDRQRP